MIALLSGVYGLSKRSVQSILADFFHIPISLGSICVCEAAVSEALAEPVKQARGHVQSAEVLHADETGWREANNKAWLWVAATGTVTVFMIHAKRGQVAARELLGAFCGVLVSDRWGGYNFNAGARQWCWAHLRPCLGAEPERRQSRDGLTGDMNRMPLDAFGISLWGWGSGSV